MEKRKEPTLKLRKYEVVFINPFKVFKFHNGKYLGIKAPKFCWKKKGTSFTYAWSTGLGYLEILRLKHVRQDYETS
jgi:hypothetical protein